MKIKTYIIIIMMLISPVGAFELDASIDDEIRKNYNPTALEDTLPAPPKIKPTKQNPNNTSANIKPPKTQIKTDNYIQYSKPSPVVTNIDNDCNKNKKRHKIQSQIKRIFIRYYK